MQKRFLSSNSEESYFYFDNICIAILFPVTEMNGGILRHQTDIYCFVNASVDWEMIFE